MLKDATDWLSDVLGENASRTITYTRSSASATITTAQVGRTLFRLNDSNGVRMQHGDRDYIVPAAVLVLSGSVATPKVGDRITDSVDGRVYEVRAPQANEPAFRPSDPTGTDWRIHCVKVS